MHLQIIKAVGLMSSMDHCGGVTLIFYWQAKEYRSWDTGRRDFPLIFHLAVVVLVYMHLQLYTRLVHMFLVIA